MGSRPFAKYVLGTSLCEDIVCVGAIAVATGLANGGGMSAGAFAASLGWLAVFFLAVVVIGLVHVPRLLVSVSSRKDDEALALTILGVCFFVSFLAYRFNFSLALGAFLVGFLGASSDVRERLAALVDPLKSMFSAMFFVSIGLLVDPAALWAHGGAILVVSLVVVAGKLFNNTFASLLSGVDVKTAVQNGFSLAQIGEFAFMVAILYAQLVGDPSNPMFSIAVGASLLTTLFNPLMIRVSDRVGDFAERALPGRFRSVLEAYRAWLAKIGAAEGSPAFRRLKSEVFRIGVYAVLMIAVATMCTLLTHVNYSGVSPFFASNAKVFFFVLAHLLCLPLLPLGVSASRGLADAVGGDGIRLHRAEGPDALGRHWRHCPRRDHRLAPLCQGGLSRDEALPRCADCRGAARESCADDGACRAGRGGDRSASDFARHRWHGRVAQYPREDRRFRRLRGARRRCCAQHRSRVGVPRRRHHRRARQPRADRRAKGPFGGDVVKKKILLAALAAFLAILSVCLQFALRAARPASAPAMTEGALAAFGGLRSIVAEVVWFRADRLQDEGRYVELAQLASTLSYLEPHTPEVWSYAAWNLAYNISIMMPTYEDRWRWVYAAICLVRDKGLVLNPTESELYRELAWLFELKLGTNLDVAAPVYREKWREMVEDVARRSAWEELRMDGRVMDEVAKSYGMSDIADPMFSAVYWAHIGRVVSKKKEDLAFLNEIIRQSRAIYRRSHRNEP